MKETDNWFEYARQDLQMAELAFREEIFNQSCFHSQQAVEKLLKGYLLASNKPYPKIHSLGDLLNLSTKVDKEFDNFKEKCLKLDKYYIPMRYPDTLPGSLPDGLPNEKDAAEAIGFAKEIMGFVMKKVR